MRFNSEYPAVIPGHRIGILGGSFDPPHSGHVLVTLWALKCFGLDRVWWLVSPGNPLKTERPIPIEKRMDAACRIMRHPRVEISNFEEQVGTRYSYQTVARLKRRFPKANFVWLMGADSMSQLHNWKKWNSFVKDVPIGVFARPGQNIPARFSVAAVRYMRFKLPQERSRALPCRRAARVDVGQCADGSDIVHKNQARRTLESLVAGRRPTDAKKFTENGV